MNIKHRILTLCIVLCSSLALFGQQVTDLRLNEMLIVNDSNYVDEYGRHVPWIEIFNTSYNQVNIAGCYLTDDTTGLSVGDASRWYRIPTTDPTTWIPQRSSKVFFLDNSPLYGTYHTNIDPSTSETRYIALINSNGKTLIDMFVYPAELLTSTQSFGCYDDGISTKVENGKKVKNMGMLPYATPGSVNKVQVGATKSEHLQKSDPHGIGLAVISISVVFAALLMIFLMLKLFGYMATRKDRKAKKEQVVATVAANGTADVAANEVGPTGEELAAITMALHLFFNSQHDEESEVITIDMPSKHYSPWSQKNLVMKRVVRRR
ncbi:MAG: OadG family protein [Bacteroidales bacterium]|nr:OadG family protein [Bacteroidales bacterium]